MAGSCFGMASHHSPPLDQDTCCDQSCPDTANSIAAVSFSSNGVSPNSDPGYGNDPQTLQPTVVVSTLLLLLSELGLPDPHTESAVEARESSILGLRSFVPLITSIDRFASQQSRWRPRSRGRPWYWMWIRWWHGGR